MTVRIFSHPSSMKHVNDADHPEAPSRLHAINDQLLSSGLDYVVQHQMARAATDMELMLAHDPGYVQWVIKQSPTEGYVWLDGDTQMMAKSLDAARHAAGAGLDAVDWVMQAENRRAFCAIRPPGHHATAFEAMGFCLFNNVAVAAKYAQQQYQLTRLAIIDFDVHHGNGTEQIFGSDPNVLFCSSFEHPYYPFPDLSESDSLLKMPLGPGSTGADFRQHFTEQWQQAIVQFQPQLLLVSAGFDAHAEDDMGHLRWNDSDYQWIGEQLKAIAEQCCHGRIVACLEGGYSHSALGRSVVSFLRSWL